MTKEIAVLFEKEYTDLAVSSSSGSIASVIEKPYRVDVTTENAKTDIGAEATVMTVRFNGRGFSFFLRDVRQDYPIIIPEYGAAVTEGADSRSYSDILRAVKAKNRQSALEKIESAPEESFESAAEHNRSLKAATWLGISRDVRMFEVGVRDYKTDQWDTLTRNVEGWDTVSPRSFGGYISNDELPAKQVKYVFMTGRGVGCESDVKRELEDGFLPILIQTNTDNGILYTTTYFASNEFSPLSANGLFGTNALAANALGLGAVIPKEHQKKVDASLEVEKERQQHESIVLHIRFSMKNTGCVPRYAFIHLPDPLMFRTSAPKDKIIPAFDSDSGLGLMPSGLVYMSAKADNAAPLQNEMSILLLPGESLNIDCVLPHTPLPRERGEKLLCESFDERKEECRKFWYDKLSRYGEITLPEKRINDMLKAGIIHLELVSFGCENGGAVVPAVGKYTAIGSESSPVIQLIDSLGNSYLAERALDFFLNIQRDDGFIHNYLGYTLETGFVLWTMGNHYLYTRDEKWASRVSQNVIDACEYCIKWIENNLDESLTLRGYGMLDGRTDDTEVYYHSYMLNAGMYAGFCGASLILKESHPDLSEKYSKEADKLKENIIASLNESIITSPAVPLGNGCWVPSFASYPESIGASALYCKSGSYYSHGTFLVRELSGAAYLPFLGVIDPKGEISGQMEEYTADFICHKNSAFSQPYYSPHPFINLARGRVKPFISEFYNSMSALADRETYTFCEHFFEASIHKTHEEAQFLMRLCEMLRFEYGSELHLLAGIPRKWLEEGKKITAKNIKTKFGTLSFEVFSNLSANKISAAVSLESNGVIPEKLTVRLPHPEGKKPVKVLGGDYLSENEAVSVRANGDTCEITLIF